MNVRRVPTGAHRAFMDPTACLKRIADALEESDWTEAHYGCLDLAKWLDGGGFMPDDKNRLAFVLSSFADELKRHRQVDD